jgi:hypothetical protein
MKLHIVPPLHECDPDDIREEYYMWGDTIFIDRDIDRDGEYITAFIGSRNGIF